MQETTRDKVMTVPLSEEEMLLAKQAADKLGMSLSAFIRLLIKNFADGIRFEKKNSGE